METLFYLQPFASGLATMCGCLFGVGLFVAVFAYAVRLILETSPHETDNEASVAAKKVTKLARTIAVVFGVGLLLSWPVSLTWESYKRVMVYRALESDTTEQAVDTLEAMLGRLERVAESDLEP